MSTSNFIIMFMCISSGWATSGYYSTIPKDINYVLLNRYRVADIPEITQNKASETKVDVGTEDEGRCSEYIKVTAEAFERLREVEKENAALKQMTMNTINRIDTNVHEFVKASNQTNGDKQEAHVPLKQEIDRVNQSYIQEGNAVLKQEVKETINRIDTDLQEFINASRQTSDDMQESHILLQQEIYRLNQNYTVEDNATLMQTMMEIIIRIDTELQGFINTSRQTNGDMQESHTLLQQNSERVNQTYSDVRNRFSDYFTVAAKSFERLQDVEDENAALKQMITEITDRIDKDVQVFLNASRPTDNHLQESQILQYQEIDRVNQTYIQEENAALNRTMMETINRIDTDLQIFINASRQTIDDMQVSNILLQHEIDSVNQTNSEKENAALKQTMMEIINHTDTELQEFINASRQTNDDMQQSYILLQYEIETVNQTYAEEENATIKQIMMEKINQIDIDLQKFLNASRRTNGDMQESHIFLQQIIDRVNQTYTGQENATLKQTMMKIINRIDLNLQKFINASRQTDDDMQESHIVLQQTIESVNQPYPENAALNRTMIETINRIDTDLQTFVNASRQTIDDMQVSNILLQLEIDSVNQTNTEKENVALKQTMMEIINHTDTELQEFINASRKTNDDMQQSYILLQYEIDRVNQTYAGEKNASIKQIMMEKINQIDIDLQKFLNASRRTNGDMQESHIFLQQIIDRVNQTYTGQENATLKQTMMKIINRIDLNLQKFINASRQTDDDMQESHIVLQQTIESVNQPYTENAALNRTMIETINRIDTDLQTFVNASRQTIDDMQVSNILLQLEIDSVNQTNTEKENAALKQTMMEIINHTDTELQEFINASRQTNDDMQQSYILLQYEIDRVNQTYAGEKNASIKQIMMEKINQIDIDLQKFLNASRRTNGDMQESHIFLQQIIDRVNQTYTGQENATLKQTMMKIINRIDLNLQKFINASRQTDDDMQESHFVLQQTIESVNQPYTEDRSQSSDYFTVTAKAFERLQEVEKENTALKQMMMKKTNRIDTDLQTFSNASRQTDVDMNESHNRLQQEIDRVNQTYIQEENTALKQTMMETMNRMDADLQEYINASRQTNNGMHESHILLQHEIDRLNQNYTEEENATIKQVITVIINRIDTELQEFIDASRQTIDDMQELYILLQKKIKRVNLFYTEDRSRFSKYFTVTANAFERLKEVEKENAALKQIMTKKTTNRLNTDVKAFLNASRPDNYTQESYILLRHEIARVNQTNIQEGNAALKRTMMETIYRIDTDLQKFINASRQTNDHIQESHILLQYEIDKVNQSYNEQENATLKQTMMKIINRIDIDLQKFINASRQTNDDIQKSHILLQRKIETCNKISSEDRHRVSEYVNVTAKAFEKLREVENENAALKQEMMETKNQMDTNVDEFSAPNKQTNVDMQKESKMHLKQDIDSLDRSYMQVKNTALKQMKSKHRTDTDVPEFINKSKQTDSDMQQSYILLQEKIDRINQTYTEDRSRLSEYFKVTTKAFERLQEVEEENVALKQTMMEITNRIDTDLQAFISASGQTNGDMQESHIFLQQEIDRVNETYSEDKSQFYKYFEATTKALERLQEVEGENAALKQTMKETTNRIDTDLQEFLNESRQTNGDTQESYILLQQEIDLLNQTYMKDRKRFSKYFEATDTTFNGLQKVKEENAALKQTMNKTTNRIDTDVQKFMNACRKTTVDMQESHILLEEEIDRINQTCSTVSTDLQINTENLKRDIMNVAFDVAYTLNVTNDLVTKMNPPEGAQQCRTGWKRYKDSCYFFSSTNVDWNKAHIQCEAGMDGYLIEIETEDEESFIRNQAKLHHAADPTKDERGYWIGASDADVEKDWIWVKSRNQLNFTDWSSGEYNNYHGNENCGHLWALKDFHWNDILCSAEMHFICERPLHA